MNKQKLQSMWIKLSKKFFYAEGIKFEELVENIKELTIKI